MPSSLLFRRVLIYTPCSPTSFCSLVPRDVQNDGPLSVVIKEEYHYTEFVWRNIIM